MIMPSIVLEGREVELEELLSEKLKPMNSKVFYLMVNYSLVEWHNNKLACCRFSEGKGRVDGKLEIGYLSRINGKTVLVPDDDLKNAIFMSSVDLEFGGVECINYIKDFIFDIEVNSDLRLINIVNSGFKQLFNVIYAESDSRSATSSIVSATNNRIPHSDVIKLYNYFDSASFFNYSTLVNRRLIRFLKRSNTVYQSGVTPMFYRTLSQWVPVFVTGKCIFNPFLEAKANYEVMKDSELLTLATNHVEEFNGFRIYYLTHKSISESLNFSRVISCDSYFLANLLGGFFQDSLPRKDSYIYISKEGGFINQEAYSNLSASEKQLYSPRSTLFLLCNSCIRRTNLNKVSTFYDIVKNSNLKKKVINNG